MKIAAGCVCIFLVPVFVVMLANSSRGYRIFIGARSFLRPPEPAGFLAQGNRIHFSDKVTTELSVDSYRSWKFLKQKTKQNKKPRLFLFESTTCLTTALSRAAEPGKCCA